MGNVHQESTIPSLPFCCPSGPGSKIQPVSPTGRSPPSQHLDPDPYGFRDSHHLHLFRNRCPSKAETWPSGWSPASPGTADTSVTNRALLSHSQRRYLLLPFPGLDLGKWEVPEWTASPVHSLLIEIQSIFFKPNQTEHLNHSLHFILIPKGSKYVYLILNTEFIFWLNVTGCHPRDSPPTCPHSHLVALLAWGLIW